LKIPKENFMKADSHKYIKSIIEKLPEKSQFKIVNIDFHHDYYHYYRGNDYYNCGNWLRRVLEERPDAKVNGSEERTRKSTVWTEYSHLNILMI